ncbi:HAD-IIB family hydrolase [Devosia subaequoris]|uniref:HAD family hydrolase n=1 Tax=Devosia subaequoris TaxID=395930 RepID=UPI0016139F6F
MKFRGPSPQPAELRGVRYLFTDVDDTLTTGGRLLPQTFQALWDLHDAGVSVIPVTGGSAGWCEHMVRAWPVAAAIGESGAFLMTSKGNTAQIQFWEDEVLQARRQQHHLEAVRPLLGEFRFAHDQRLRVADVAIDIVGKARSEVEALAQQIREIGGTVAISSVHINTWIGAYNKQTMSERLLAQWGIMAQEITDTVSFVGDSRNDAPMFAMVTKSFGVANIGPVLEHLPTPPRWISTGEAGIGFVEIAQAIIAARTASTPL